ncbi:MAG: MarC family protein [Spirulinaceae cyanobacterium SM2_1_0]|nr:MarC family protein [Spirulinaceae cyanobacterium SM2_1_0]
MNVISAALLLLLIMDPFGNLVLINTLLADWPVRKRRWIILREALIAYLLLVFFLVAGNQILGFLGIEQPALSISGGVVLFLIALGMVFPDRSVAPTSLEVEPLIVPVAVPLIAGPSAIAALLVFVSREPESLGRWFLAVTLASAVVTLILSLSPPLFQRLGKRGAIAIEKLMGMLLIMLSVQMLLNGLESYLNG